MAKLEEIKTKIKIQEEISREMQEREKLRRRQWRKEKEAEEAKRLIRESEKKERKEKQRIMEERWKLTRWLTDFVDLNTDRWGEFDGREVKYDSRREEIPGPDG